MKSFIQTRSKTVDYGFLGHSPEESWWHEFRSLTSFEKPTLLVKSEKEYWRLYLSGIPSARLDRVSTAIRYTVVIEGAAHEAIDGARKIVSYWVAYAASSAEFCDLQRVLDEALPEELVERLLHDRSGRAASETEVLLGRAIGCLPRLEMQPAQDDLSSWVGALREKSSQTKFLCRVETLLKGRSGVALVVNLVGNEEEARRISSHDQEIAVLLVDPDPSFPADKVLPLEKKDSDQWTQGRSSVTSYTNIQARIGFPRPIVIFVVLALMGMGLYYLHEMHPVRITLTPQADHLVR